MDVVSIIGKKRDGGTLSRSEIEYFVSGFVAGRIPDYQMGALLMAICVRGMELQETVDLTRAMIDSGSRLDLGSLAGAKIDKHSTGGVGDKTTLVVAPIVAAAGVTIAKLSGRGLGHTGGTLDKLEAIPGLRTDLTPAELVAQAGRIGLAIAGQTADIVPADKKIYALRDVTGTVGSVPLITASVVSKKIAGGADGIVLDVKCGSGAFAENVKEARALARGLVDVSRELGAKAVAVITDMDQPLGLAVGNALEVAEAIEVLDGRGPADVREISIELGARMIAMAGQGGTARDVAGDVADARSTAAALLDDGSAKAKFAQMIQAQDGDARVVADPAGILPRARHSREIAVTRGGFVVSIDAEAVGAVSGMIGAGRTALDDAIDPGAGVVLHFKVGQEVGDGDVLAVMHGSDASEIEEVAPALFAAFELGEEPPGKRPLVIDVVE